jgi:hypothetical protein
MMVRICEGTGDESDLWEAPARRIGCLMPNSSVMGVEMTDMVTSVYLRQRGRIAGMG